MEAVAAERYAEFERELDALVRLYHRHDANIDPRHVRRVVEEGWAAKVHLRDVLGLGPDLRVQFKTQPTVDDLYRHPFIDRVATFIDSVINPLTWSEVGGNIYAALIAGKVVHKGRELRLGKFLAGRIPEEAWAAEREKFRDRYALYMLKRDADPAELDKRTFNDALSKALELVSHLGRDTILSFNPLDILLASEQAGFRSCHRFGGEYGNGPIAYARDGFTGIVFHADLQREPRFPYFKVGRAMVYITHPYAAYTIGRGYGSLDRNHTGVKAISEFIGDRIAASQKVPSTWVGKANHQYDGEVHNYQTPIYFDFIVSRYTYHKDLTADERYPAPDLHFEVARCLYCGDLTDEPEGLACWDCTKKVKCDQCGGSFNPEDEGIYFENEYYCNSCEERLLHYCEGCEEINHAEEIQRVYDRYGRPVYRCSWCVQREYRECEDCRDIHHEECGQYSEYHNKWVCDECLAAYSQCEACDDLIADDEIAETKDGLRLGPCCIKNDHMECPGCSEWAPDETFKAVDGLTVCEDCAEGAVCKEGA